jgi:hypothetical protein
MELKLSLGLVIHLVLTEALVPWAGLCPAQGLDNSLSYCLVLRTTLWFPYAEGQSPGLYPRQVLGIYYT